MPPLEIQIEIAATPAQVWAYLTTPALMRTWMGGDDYQMEIEADWRVGGEICIRAFHIMPFENRGTVLVWEPETRLQYDHLSSLSLLPDIPENHTQFTFALTPTGDSTLLDIQIAQFPSETIYHHLEFYWRVTRNLLKEAVEVGLE